MKRILLLSLAVLLALSSTQAEGKAKLFKNGRSGYSIVISSDASTSEQTAAKELQQFLKEISGAQIPVTNDLKCRGRKIYVGYNPVVGKKVKAEPFDDLDETFVYKSIGRNIYIYGGRQRGTMYGVYTFLERELGCRWYTPDFSKIPTMNEWTFSRLDHSESPAVKYRYSNYFDVNHAPAWSAHNKENTKWTPSANEYGNLEAYWSCHTFGHFIPEKEFFDSHPEYFSFKNGKRIKDGQICLSNPEVLKICTERLAEVMRNEPLNRIYSLSQNDNFGFCECEECKKIEEQYGGHSGIILWFVNQAADAVKDEFPDKFVGTFAYQYGRKPPVGIVPRDNVVIRLCDIECCFSHPIEAGCPQNIDFMKDMQEWKKIAPHLFIWDYIVDYAQYLAPFPNFSTLGPNIKTFRDNNAIGIFEEAQYQSGASEFCELRTWVVTKLLWDPEQDVNELAKDFIFGYYGSSAQMIWDYYNLVQSLVKPDTHLSIFAKSDDPIYTPEFISAGEVILKQALEAADSDIIRERVQKVWMQILYLKFMKNKPESLTDGTWEELKGYLLKFNARTYEWKSLPDYIKEIDNSIK